MIKVGQVYKCKNEDICAITHKSYGFYHVIYDNGFTEFVIEDDKDFFSFWDLIAEYPTWQEAINSKEFKGE